MKGSFVCDDGVKYIVNAVVRVAARDSDNDFVDITLQETGEPSGVENLEDGLRCDVTKLLRNGQLLIIHNGNTYRLDGQQIQ